MAAVSDTTYHRNHWLFSSVSNHTLSRANSTATVEADEAERDIVEHYRTGRRRRPLTEWSDLADPFEPAATEDWDPVRSVRLATAGTKPTSQTPAILARARLRKRLAYQVGVQGPGPCVNCGYDQAGEHSFAEIGTCTLTLRRGDGGGAEPS